MANSAAVLLVEYRQRGYSPEQIQVLKTALEEIGPVRVRPLRLPEAGGSFEIWIALDFVGKAIVGGIIEHIASKHWDRLAAAFTQFFKNKVSDDGFEPEMSLRVTYDDVDLVIGPITR